MSRDAGAGAAEGLERADATVRLLGRSFPRAAGAERLAWAAFLVVVLSVLYLATTLNPDRRGIGTHEQIGLGAFRLPPCGFALATGYPCPSCGFTTCFALGTHGRFVDAIRNQPFGFLAFLGACLSVPVALAASVGGVSWARFTDEWPWVRIIVATVLLWLLAWGYKISLLHAMARP